MDELQRDYQRKMAEVEQDFDSNGRQIRSFQDEEEHERRHGSGRHHGDRDEERRGSNKLGDHNGKKHKKVWKKIGKHLLIFAVVALVLTLLVKRFRRRREMRRRDRMNQLQQQLQNNPAPTNFAPQSAPQNFNHPHRNLIPVPHPQALFHHNVAAPAPTHYSPPRAPERNEPYVPFNPQNNYNPLPKVAEVPKKEINIESRDKEIEMKAFQNKNQEQHQIYRDEHSHNQAHSHQDQVQYLPVRIMPNGQMVLLAPPNAPQYQPPRQNQYPNLDVPVVVGSPVPSQQYNYPMKSQ